MVNAQPSETGSDGQSNRVFSIFIPYFDSTIHSLSYKLDLCHCNSAPVSISYTAFSNYQIIGILDEGESTN